MRVMSTRYLWERKVKKGKGKKKNRKNGNRYRLWDSGAPLSCLKPAAPFAATVQFAEPNSAWLQTRNVSRMLSWEAVSGKLMLSAQESVASL
ncbi:hypothetical protein VTK56DRAFT_6470 [Thermocarpiscus australiensis]